MANKLIVDPLLVINNEVVKYKPNSLTYMLGRGEIKLTAETAGGGNISIVRGMDLTSKFSTVKFELFATADNISLIETLLNIEDGFVVTLTDGEDLSFTCTRGWIVNDVEFKHGPEESIAIEIKGTPLI